MTVCTAIFAVAGALVSASSTEGGEVRADDNRLLERPAFVGGDASGVTASAGQNESLLILGKDRDAGANSTVRAVISATSADLVLLNAGYNNNIRPGMVCVIERQGKAIASFVIAESAAERAAGPILTCIPEAPIQPGDIARIKTVLFN